MECCDCDSATGRCNKVAPRLIQIILLNLFGTRQRKLNALASTTSTMLPERIPMTRTMRSLAIGTGSSSSASRASVLRFFSLDMTGARMCETASECVTALRASAADRLPAVLYRIFERCDRYSSGHDQQPVVSSKFTQTTTRGDMALVQANASSFSEPLPRDVNAGFAGIFHSFLQLFDHEYSMG
jgi:hypothetical protein